MLAFHNDIKIKRKYVNRVMKHRRADEIIKGKYWEGGKGCAVGCTIHSGNHSSYETELGIPRVLARLEDSIFESLPNDLAKKWPEQFLKAIKPGADLSKVWYQFAVWLLTDPKHGVLQYANTKKTQKSINNVANLYLRYLKGEQVTVKEWRAAAADAYAAADAADAAYAAYAADAAYAAAAAAAADAAAAAAAAADAAAAAAAAAADAAAARQKARIAQSEKLLELLREAK